MERKLFCNNIYLSRYKLLIIYIASIGAILLGLYMANYRMIEKIQGAVACSQAEAKVLFFFFGIVLLIVDTIVFVYYKIIVFKNPKAEYIFASLALIFGIIYIFAFTPLSIPDEVFHYPASYQISNSITFQEFGESADFDFSDCTPHANTARGLIYVLTNFFATTKHLGNTTVDVMNTVSTLVYPIEYLPQAIGISLARFLDLNFVQTFLMGRLFNLILYCICLFFAVKVSPIFKRAIGIIGITPMAMQQASSYSYDAFINGMCFLLIALLFNLIYGHKKITVKAFAITTIVAALLTPAKGAYAVLIFLFLLIPVENFKDKKEKTKYFIILFSSCVASFLLFSIPAIKTSFEVTNQSTSTEYYTAAYVLTHPLRISKIIIKTILNDIIQMFLNSLGLTLSGLSLWVPMYVPVLYIAILICCVQNGSETDICISLKDKSCFILSSILVYVLFLIALLLTWTPSSYDLVAGFQGRYLTPILPIIMAAFNNRNCVYVEKTYKRLSMAAIVLSSYVVIHVTYFTLFH